MTLLLDQYNITLAETEDAPAIADLQLKLAWETEEYALDLDRVTQGVRALLQDPHKGRYYIVKDQEQMIACVMNTYEWSDWRNGQILWIQSLYILSEYRGKGLYRAMYEFLQAEVQSTPELKGIRLYADKSNERALKVYQALGMNQEHYTMFEWMPE